MIVSEQHPVYLQFANHILSTSFSQQNVKTLANVAEGGEILAVIVYSRFAPHNIEMSIASSSPRWATKGFIRAAYTYPFVQLNKRRITAVVEDGNDKAVAMNKKLGHIEEGRLKCWFGDKDGIIFRMLREECKWLEA